MAFLILKANWHVRAMLGDPVVAPTPNRQRHGAVAIRRPAPRSASEQEHHAVTKGCSSPLCCDGAANRLDNDHLRNGRARVAIRWILYVSGLTDGYLGRA